MQRSVTGLRKTYNLNNFESIHNYFTVKILLACDILVIGLNTCRWGHAASKVGSSSSGSNSAPVGLEDGGNVRNIFTANWNHTCLWELWNKWMIKKDFKDGLDWESFTRTILITVCKNTSYITQQFKQWDTFILL